jgi:hypothetical protein
VRCIRSPYRSIWYHPNGNGSLPHPQIMLRRSNKIHRYVQKHPITAYFFAISLIIFVSGVFLQIGGRYLVHTPGFADSLSLRYHLQLSGDHDGSVFGSWSLFVQRIQTSVCNLYGHVAGTFLHVGERAREVGPVFIALADRHKTVSRQLLRHPWIARIINFQVLKQHRISAAESSGLGLQDVKRRQQRRCTLLHSPVS